MDMDRTTLVYIYIYVCVCIYILIYIYTYIGWSGRHYSMAEVRIGTSIICGVYGQLSDIIGSIGRYWYIDNLQCLWLTGRYYDLRRLVY